MNEKDDNYKFHLMSEMGVHINDPTPISIFPSNIFEYKKLTWAEQRRNYLVKKLKQRKALLNKFIVAAFMILSVLVIFVVMLFLAHLLHPIAPDGTFGLPIAVFGVFSIIHCYYWITDKFECDMFYIRVYHWNPGHTKAKRYGMYY